MTSKWSDIKREKGVPADYKTPLSDHLPAICCREHAALAARVHTVIDLSTIDRERLAEAMNEAYAYLDRDNTIAAIPFIDDWDNFWWPFAEVVLAALDASPAPREETTPAHPSRCGHMDAGLNSEP